MIVLYVLGYFNRNKQNSYAALIRAQCNITGNVKSSVYNISVTTILNDRWPFQERQFANFAELDFPRDALFRMHIAFAVQFRSRGF